MSMPHPDRPTLEDELFGPNSPLTVPPKKKFPWGALAFGAVVVLVAGGVAAAVVAGSRGSRTASAPSISTTTTPAVPSQGDLQKLLLTSGDVPTGWTTVTAGAPANEKSVVTGLNADCTKAFGQIYAASAAPTVAAATAYAAPSLPPPPAPPPPPPPGPPRPGPPPPPPGPPPPPPAPVDGPLSVVTSVSVFPVDTAAANYKLFVDTTLKCPTYTALDGTQVAMTEGDDANSLGDESMLFHADYTVGRNTTHAVVWRSRSGGKIWTLQYNYLGAFDRNVEKKIVRQAVAEWRAGTS